MGDPELRSDETILVRTNGIYVKGIPFEGILTNRRILLLDKAKNLQPPKEISLATIKDIEPGENAIRDQVITLSMVTKTGDFRQMILTFSRQTGGNRIKERDEWLKFLRVHTGPSFEPSVRRSPPVEQEVRFQEQPAPPRIEIVNSPIPQAQPRSERIPIRKEVETPRPVKRIIESAPAPAPVVHDSEPLSPPEPSTPSFGLYCSRCGNRLSEGSAFCNRCGSPIAAQGVVTRPTPARTAAPEPVRQTVREPAPAPVSRRNEPVTGQVAIEPDELSWEDMPEQPVQKPRAPTRPTIPAMIPEDEFDRTPAPATVAPTTGKPAKAKTAKKGFLSRLFSPKGRVQKPARPESAPARSIPPPPKKTKKSSGPGFRPGKRTIFAAIGIVVVVVILLAGVLVVYPMISSGGLKLPGGGTSGTTTPTPVAAVTTAALSSGPSGQGTLVIPKETTPVPIPATGTYVHVNYLGGWKGTYGTPKETLTAQDSGEKILEVLNATGTVQASFSKQDKSTRHAITVEIYKDGKLLTSGNTDAALGIVTLSVDVTTGVAKAPQSSPGTASPAPAATAKAGTTTSPASANVTASKTAAPATNATAAH